jgi:hypothetical protein
VLVAEILEANVERFVDMLMDVSGDADAPGLGQGLHARRDVDTVAV